VLPTILAIARKEVGFGSRALSRIRINVLWAVQRNLSLPSSIALVIVIAFHVRAAAYWAA
jgi:hypothetical protein